MGVSLKRGGYANSIEICISFLDKPNASEQERLESYNASFYIV
jgi:hypothetical protein